MRKDEHFRMIQKAVIEIECEKVLKLDLDTMREIASILVEAGADINAEHTVSNRIYSPLTFAEEIEEVDLLCQHN